MIDNMRVGIIGVGNMGSGHANRILKAEIPGMILTAVCDVNPDKLKPFEGKEDVKLFDKGEDLIADAKEGIHSVELGNAMILSGLKDKTVELPLDAAEYAALLKEKIATSTFEKETVETSGAADDFSKSF